MILSSLLEIARQYKKIKPLNEKYNNNLIQKWQQQIWDGYWYNNQDRLFVSSREYDDIWYYGIDIHDFYIDILRQYKKSIKDVTDINVQKDNLKKLIAFYTDGYKVFESSAYFHRNITDYKACNNIQSYRMQPLSVILRNYKDLLKKDDSLKDSVFFGYKMTEISNEDLEIIPQDKCRSKQYSQYLMFWTTPEDELFAVSFNHKILLAFEKENFAVYYNRTSTKIFVNPLMINKPLSFDDIPEIPDECLSDEYKFLYFLMNIVKPFYIKKTYGTVTTYKDMKDAHESQSTKIFKSENFKYAGFLTTELGTIYGIDLAKNNHTDEAHERINYNVWLSEEKDKIQRERRQIKQLISSVKQIKEYTSLKDKLIKWSDYLYEFHEFLLECVSYAFKNKLNFLSQTYDYNSTYYNGITKLCDYINNANDIILDTFKIFEEIKKFENISYAKKNISTLQDYQYQIKRNKSLIENILDNMQKITYINNFIDKLIIVIVDKIKINSKLMDIMQKPSQSFRYNLFLF